MDVRINQSLYNAIVNCIQSRIVYSFNPKYPSNACVGIRESSPFRRENVNIL